MSESDLYGRLLRGMICPVGDWWRGIPIGRVLEDLRESQWWPAQRLRELQDQKLRALVGTVYEDVPYYRQVMDANSVRPADIRGVKDLAKLPLLTSELIFRSGPEGMLNRRLSMRDLLARRTSGTTGIPKRFFLSKACRAMDQAVLYRHLEWCGIERGDRYFLVWGQPVVSTALGRLQRRAKLRVLSRTEVLDTYGMTDQAMGRFARRLAKARPTVLRGYPSGLVRFARFIRSEGLKVDTVKAISATAEQLLPCDRALLEEVFQTEVFDQYGCGECMGIAYECPRHEGLHISVEHCIVEVIDDRGRVVEPGRSGRIVITNLDNEAFPFIRYVCGDEGSLLPRKCSCGRGLPLMSSIEGRTTDMICGVNGNRVSGLFFTALMMGLGLNERLRIREFQFVQTTADHLRLDLVSARPPSAAEMEAVRIHVCRHLGPMRVDCQQVEAIDRGQSGKVRYTFREWCGGQGATGFVR